MPVYHIRLSDPRLPDLPMEFDLNTKKTLRCTVDAGGLVRVFDEFRDQLFVARVVETGGVRQVVDATPENEEWVSMIEYAVNGREF